VACISGTADPLTTAVGLERASVNRVLIVEDEPRIAAFLDKGLAAHGFATTVLRGGTDADRAVAAGDVDLVILDSPRVGPLGSDIVAVRGAPSWAVPVIMLAVQEVVDECAHAPAGDGVRTNGGGVRYLVKPFRFEELLALVREMLGDDHDRSTVLAYRDVELDLNTRRASVNGREAQLTPREFRLAETFFRRPGQAFSRAQLLDQVWGLHFDPGSNVVDVLGSIAGMVETFPRLSEQTMRV
jgi:DNA-binding response OmpR family regulator